MDSIQIASGIVESLREENRLSSLTLHQAQSIIKQLEKQLSEKQQIIAILEERLRVGSNSFLEVSNRQKDLTIKHLELQIQKLLKQNEELESNINALKSEICPRCETKIFLGIADEKVVPKRAKTIKPSLTKKAPQRDYADRQKTLEKIIEHKDKRIMHLSKEVQRLTEAEKELNNKTYRLSKLLPLSNMPSEVLTECLLKEIQLLEGQVQSYKKLFDKNQHSGSATHISKCFPKTSISDLSLVKRSFHDLDSKTNKKSDVDNIEKEDKTVSNLHMLYNDINELKHMFTIENEKLQQSLNQDFLKHNLLKIEWKDIISKLNDIAVAIQNIIHINSSFKDKEKADYTSDKDSVILRLQERMKDALELSTEYKNENETLRERVTSLNKKITELEKNHQFTSDKLTKLQEEQTNLTNGPVTSSYSKNDTEKLKEMLNFKQSELEAANNHLKTCQNFISELQSSHKKTSDHQFHLPTNVTGYPNVHTHISTMTANKSVSSPVLNSDLSHRMSEHKKSDLNANEQQIKCLKTKLEVSEKSIKHLEDLIEKLQEENQRLDTELQIAKSRKVMPETSDNSVKLKELKTALDALKNEYNDLHNKMSLSEEENGKLHKELQNHISQNESLKVCEQEKASFKTKLDAAEKHIETIEETVVKLQNEVESLKEENVKLQTNLHISESKNHLSTVYEEDTIALKNELISKEEEIQNLKQSLHTLESKTLEMNHHRRSLRKEIENLCKVLMEESDSDIATARCKAIYKAAVLRSAQALLQFDFNDPTMTDSHQSNALEEMKHQVSIYLTEVARINELLTIKNQQREELLKEYLDVSDQDVLGISSSHEFHMHERSDVASGKESVQVSKKQSSSESIIQMSDEFNGHYGEKNIQTENCLRTVSSHVYSEDVLTNIREELTGSRSLATYFMSNCTRLEDLLREEQCVRSKCERDCEKNREAITELKNQLKEKSGTIKRLNDMVDMMRMQEYKEEIGMEQQKDEIQWLVNENQRLCENITTTNTELCKCKEDNSRIQNDLNAIKRQLLNEKYEHAKVNNEMKHLRQQITHSQSSAAL